MIDAVETWALNQDDSVRGKVPVRVIGLPLTGSFSAKPHHSTRLAKSNMLSCIVVKSIHNMSRQVAAQRTFGAVPTPVSLMGRV